MGKKTERVSTRVTDKWTFPKAQPPPFKTTSRNSIYNRRSSSSTNVGQSAVNAQAERSVTGTPSHFHSSGQSMENVYSKINSVASSGIHFVSSIAGEATMSEALPPPYKTTLRNSNGNRKSSPPTNVGQSGVDAQAKKSSTGSHSYIPSLDQIMENVYRTKFKK